MNIDELIAEGTFERDYRRCTLTSSLNPAIAYAMNFLVGLDAKDRILDPCYGSGTLLIERQLLKPTICIGVDIDPRALDCARQNIESAGVEIELKHGDIMGKKFPNGYFTKIISNLPYGIHTGSRKENIQLYRFLADRAINWLKVGGKAILITNAKSILKNSFEFNPSWKLASETPVQVRGLNLTIFIFERIS